MIVSWKDEAGVTRWGDDNGKEYRRHQEREARKVENKPTPAPAVVKTPATPEAAAKK